MAGLYFEEFSEGQVFEHALTRTVTEILGPTFPISLPEQSAPFLTRWPNRTSQSRRRRHRHGRRTATIPTS